MTAEVDTVKDEDKRELLAAAGMVGNIGLGMVATAAVGFFGGRYIDDWLGSTPWATIIGSILGMFTGLWSAYKQVTKK
jgi:F0F1-type ATP synthase assembly protein I